MPGPHKIRETLVQLLYSIQIEGNNNPDSTCDFDSFWQVLQEADRLKLLGSRLSSLEHATRDRNAKLERYEGLLDAALPHLVTSEQERNLADKLLTIRTLEHAWTARLHALSLSYNSASENKEEELFPLMEIFFQTNEQLIPLRNEVLSQEGEFKKLAFVLEPLFASIRKLQAVGERVTEVRYSANSVQNDLKHLKSREKEINDLKTKTTALAKKILEKQTVLDQILVEAVENFSQDRITAVDKAILRIAAYELLERKDLSTAVIISEAVENATRFSGSDSARFVNGVLGQIARNSRPQ